jgi:hypothetical protein
LFVYESALQLVFAYPSRRIGARAVANVWVHLAVWLGVALQILTILIAPLRALPGSRRRGNAARRHAGCAAHLGTRRTHMPMDD